MMFKFIKEIIYSIRAIRKLNDSEYYGGGLTQLSRKELENIFKRGDED